MKNFAVTGVCGYVAPRHLRAIRDTNNRLVAACDPRDSAGELDRHTFDVRFFTETERFERHLEKLRRGPENERVHWLSVCSPNYLHDAHCRLGLRAGADVLCEKPLVINPWNLDALVEVERETKRRVYSVLQLRVHDRLVALRAELARTPGTRRDVVLSNVTSRGPWYDVSWKGSAEKSGGVPANIGVHFFDLLLWLFGPVEAVRVHLAEPRRWSGVLELERARVRWFLSVEPDDLPFTAAPGGRATHRSITIDGTEIEFSDGFSDLHTRVYERTLAGEGFGIDEARSSIELTYAVRNAAPCAPTTDSHPMLRR